MRQQERFWSNQKEGRQMGWKGPVKNTRKTDSNEQEKENIPQAPTIHPKGLLEKQGRTELRQELKYEKYTSEAL